jgi:hypothetical protein
LEDRWWVSRQDVLWLWIGLLRHLVRSKYVKYVKYVDIDLWMRYATQAFHKMLSRLARPKSFRSNITSRKQYRSIQTLTKSRVNFTTQPLLTKYTYGSLIINGSTIRTFSSESNIPATRKDEDMQAVHQLTKAFTSFIEKQGPKFMEEQGPKIKEFLETSDGQNYLKMLESNPTYKRFMKDTLDMWHVKAQAYNRYHMMDVQYSLYFSLFGGFFLCSLGVLFLLWIILLIFVNVLCK